MQKFQFRLEALLKVRILEEEQAQVKLAEAARQLDRERAVLTDMERKLDGNLADLRNSMRQLPSVGMLKNFQVYHDKLRGDIHQQTDRLQAVINYYEECMRQLEAAVQQRKLVEKLREQKLAEHNFLINQEEQKLLDEIGIQLYTRKP